jgi:hypothetical protein
MVQFSALFFQYSSPVRPRQYRPGHMLELGCTLATDSRAFYSRRRRLEPIQAGTTGRCVKMRWRGVAVYSPLRLSCSISNPFISKPNIIIHQPWINQVIPQRRTAWRWSTTNQRGGPILCMPSPSSTHLTRPSPPVLIPQSRYTHRSIQTARKSMSVIWEPGLQTRNTSNHRKRPSKVGQRDHAFLHITYILQLRERSQNRLASLVNDVRQSSGKLDICFFAAKK